MIERYVKKGYKIWDNLKDEEVYELNYRHQVTDMCYILNKLYMENQELKKEKCTFDELNYYKQKSASLETALLKEQRINLKLKSINENIKKCLNEETG